MNRANNNTLITCGCCGQESNQRIISSLYYNDRGLDGKPEHSELLAPLMRCPHCNYISYHLAKKNENAKDIISSSQYKEVIKTADEDPMHIYEAALLTTPEINEMLFLHMQYTWALEFLGNPEAAMRCRTDANMLFQDILSGAPSIPLILQYIDSLRQQGNFTNARALADSVSIYLDAYKDIYSLENKILHFEQNLIIAEDAAPHMLSEV